MVLRQRQSLAVRNPKLPFHQVLAGDGLGHRMLHLQPGVHFHEPDAVRPQSLGSVGDEFDGAGPNIIHRQRGFHRGGAQPSARLFVHARRGRFLNHLLVTALQRTVALEQMHDIAVSVAEYLHFDMARTGDVFFQQDPVVTEGGGGFAFAGGQRFVEPRRAVHPPHALAAATRHRLDQHRIADRIRLLLQARGCLVLAKIARRHRHAGRLHQFLGRVLATHGPDGGRRRADPDQSRVHHALREFRIFRQEPVAGMNCVRARIARRRQNLSRIQIAFPRRGGADAQRTVGLARKRHARIGVREYGNCFDAHAPGGADDPPCDFAPIGNQQASHHHIRNRPNRGLTGIGAFKLAASARPSTSRVCTGSMMPSSHSRAVA